MIKLWLPLSNNVRNTGLQLISTTNNGAILINSGQTYTDNLGSCNCHYFNGTTSGIKINDDVVSNLQQLTVCFWLYTTGTTVGSAFSFEVSQSWQFSCHNGLFSVRDNGSGTGGTRTDLSIGTIEANKWNHLCFMYDNGTMSIYKNGTLASTKKTSGTKLNIGITNNWIGRAHQGGNYFLNGYIRDFRVYDNVLSKEDIERINLDLAYELNSDMFFNAKIKYTKPLLAKKDRKNYRFYRKLAMYNSDAGSIDYNSLDTIYGNYYYYDGNSHLGYEFIKRNYGIFGDSLIFSYKLDNDIDNFNFSCKIYSPDTDYDMVVSVRNGRRGAVKKGFRPLIARSVIPIIENEQEISINFSRRNKTPYFKVIINAYNKWNCNSNPPPPYYAIKDIKLTELCDNLPQKTYFFDKSGIIQNKLTHPDTRFRLCKDNILINPHHYENNGAVLSTHPNIKKYINFNDTKSYVIYFYPFKNRSLTYNHNINNNYKNFCINFGGDLVISYIYQIAGYYCASFILIKYKNNYYKLYFQGVESEHYIKEIRKRFSLIIINFTQNNNNVECYDLYFNGIKLSEINSTEYKDIFEKGISTQDYNIINSKKSSAFNGYLNFFKEYNNPLPLSEIEKLNNYYCSDIINNRYIDRISPTERHEYVDFNLPSGTLWATCNLGAETPYEAGKYFQWGSCVGYLESNQHHFAAYNYTQSGLVESLSGNKYDAASRTLGNGWHIPTEYEFSELFDNTNHYFDSEKKCLVIEKDGKQIFFYANGFVNSSATIINKSIYGYYWTSTIYRTSQLYACDARIYDDVYPETDTSLRCYGLGIRPVTNIRNSGIEKYS